MIDFHTPIDEALTELFIAHGHQIGIRAEHAREGIWIQVDC